MRSITVVTYGARGIGKSAFLETLATNIYFERTDHGQDRPGVAPLQRLHRGVLFTFIELEDGVKPVQGDILMYIVAGAAAMPMKPGAGPRVIVHLSDYELALDWPHVSVTTATRFHFDTLMDHLVRLTKTLQSRR